jgi:phosphatidylglycerol---prolipoprotein diacylglyceryl transferase
MAGAGAYIEPYYFVSASAAVAIALLFPVTWHMRERSDRRRYYFLQGITILGAIVGAKLSALVGDYHWPWRGVEDWRIILGSGRSITGALIGGFVAAEFAKPLLGYTMPPNDRFAAVLPFSIGIGRIGCALTGCCLGAPHAGAWSVTYADGIARYPAQIFEAVFHFTAGLIFVWCVKKKLFFGRLFAIYLLSYGAFRFFTEFIRATPKDFGSYSAYQLFAVMMILLGTAFFVKRTVWPPKEWAVHEIKQEEARI